MLNNNKTNESNLMSVGQLAKKMNLTVRTLQYYDNEGVLKPSSQSEGGRRLYSDKDMVKLHQIISMKYLGFSLADIKNRLTLLDTPEQVAAVLTEQAEIVKSQIADLNKALSAILVLKEESLRMQSVDFKKYADIIRLWQMQNENYWVFKFFGDKTIEHIQTHFTEESGKTLYITWQNLCEQTVKLQQKGESPQEKKGQAIAKKWWDMVTEFTGGDMSMLDELEKLDQNKVNWNNGWGEKQAIADKFLSEALGEYFSNFPGGNPYVDLINFEKEVSDL